MIKLTLLDSTPTWLNPAHIVSVTTGHDQDGNTMTCVYTTCAHDKGAVEFVKEAARSVARMCDNAVPEAYVAEFSEHREDQETEVRLRPKPDYELDGSDYFEATSMPEEGTYERDDVEASTDLDEIDVIEEVPEMKH